MRIHFISIGGAVMHNLALELQANGHQVSGSDDEIYDPSHTRLSDAGLLPDIMGWDAERIQHDIDLILLGMHARAGNPELNRAMEMGLKIQSFPEFIAEHSIGKKQVVVAGSHGKTTTTSMIMHALRKNKIEFDYLVGAQIEGFDRMVRISDAPLIIIEGDEYLSSAIDRQPKFVHYNPDVLVVTGIRWDHMNVFPQESDYIEAFEKFFQKLKPDCLVYYDAQDDLATELLGEVERPFKSEAYDPVDYNVSRGKFYFGGSEEPLGVIGGHNMKNLSAATHVLKTLGLSAESCRTSLQTFRGAAKRQDLLLDSPDVVIYRDFAHAPSKVRATLKGVRELYPDRHLIAVSELHTYSSLNKEFLPQYSGALDPAESAAVFYSPHTLKIKKMPHIEFSDIRAGFNREDIEIFTETQDLFDFLQTGMKNTPCVLLIMSSGTFGGLDVDKLVKGGSQV